MMLERAIVRVGTWLRVAKRVVVLTGAGVSKESGVPTFRDALDGLWARYDPIKLATPQAFAADPALVWNFYTYRRTLMQPARPNPAHHALAALETRVPAFTLITQNIDELHEQAGSRRVLRLHGRIGADKCAAHCQGDPTPVDRTGLPGTPPRCPHCGAFIRPDVVWFHEMLPAATLAAAGEAARAADVFLIVGTSGVVEPAASLPLVAKRSGAVLIEVNPEPSQLTSAADEWLQGTAGEILPRLVACAFPPDDGAARA